MFNVPHFVVISDICWEFKFISCFSFRSVMASRSQQAYLASGSHSLINFSLLLQMPRVLPQLHRRMNNWRNKTNVKKDRMTNLVRVL